jgi:hypothetical protein
MLIGQADMYRILSAAGQIISERQLNVLPDLGNDILFLYSTKKMK